MMRPKGIADREHPPKAGRITLGEGTLEGVCGIDGEGSLIGLVVSGDGFPGLLFLSRFDHRLGHFLFSVVDLFKDRGLNVGCFVFGIVHMCVNSLHRGPVGSSH